MISKSLFFMFILCFIGPNFLSLLSFFKKNALDYEEIVNFFNCANRVNISSRHRLPSESHAYTKWNRSRRRSIASRKYKCSPVFFFVVVRRLIVRKVLWKKVEKSTFWTHHIVENYTHIINSHSLFSSTSPSSTFSLFSLVYFLQVLVWVCRTSRLAALRFSRFHWERPLTNMCAQSRQEQGEEMGEVLGF